LNKNPKKSGPAAPKHDPTDAESNRDRARAEARKSQTKNHLGA